MITVLGRLKKKLLEDCIPATMCEEIVEYLMATPDFSETMRGRWDDPATHYPDGQHNVVYATAKPYVFAWLNVNAPRAWFKTLFDTERDRVIEHGLTPPSKTFRRVIPKHG